VWSYSGVRALFDDGAANAQKTTRDYMLALDSGDGEVPLLSVFGGKITTYRCLAEDALDKLAAVFPAWRNHAGWTATKPLPGGDFPVDGADTLARHLRQDYPFLDERAARRLVRHYGTEARAILGKAKSAADLGRDFGGSLSEVEVRFLVAHEYVVSAEDIVRRRTKSGLRMTAGEIAALDAWLEDCRRQMALSLLKQAG
jgi:glycerol-3-phosphate dehydrogenase